MAMPLALAPSGQTQIASFEGLGQMPGSPGQTYANDISGDGQVVVGHAWLPDGAGLTPAAFRWTATGGFENLDKHRFSNYGFTFPAGVSVRGIEVRLDARADSTSSSPKMCVQVSWDGGTTWTSTKSTPTLGTSMGTFTLGARRIHGAAPGRPGT